MAKEEIPRVLGEYFNSASSDEALLSRTSPLNNIDKIEAPVMLFSGAKDKRVPPSHSKKMFDRMKEYGKTVMSGPH